LNNLLFKGNPCEEQHLSRQTQILISYDIIYLVFAWFAVHIRIILTLNLQKKNDFQNEKIKGISAWIIEK